MHTLLIAAGAAVLAVFVGYLVWSGLRLKLFLLSRDSPFQDQAYISVNTPNHKRSFLRAVWRREWEDRIDITLTDFKGQKYGFEFRHNLLTRYSVVPRKLEGAAKLNGKNCLVDKRRCVRSGMTLEIGDRKYSILVDTFSPGQFGLFDGERSITL